MSARFPPFPSQLHHTAVRLFASLISLLIGVVGCSGYQLAYGQPSDPDLPRKTIHVSDQLSLDFLKVPAGSFVMGSPADEKARDGDEGPQREVTISEPYYLAVHEVTQTLWTHVMGENPATFRELPDHERAPVETVSWQRSQLFLKRLSAKVPGHFRLPTEAEWEYAARAGTTTRFYWGKDAEGWRTHRYAWANSRSFARPHPVGQKKPNPWGFYDMSGNVWEWTRDWYGPYPDTAQVDPTGPEDGTRKVFRGGSWYDFPPAQRSANRHRHRTDKGYAAIGLRLVWEKGDR